MRVLKIALLACSALGAAPVVAQERLEDIERIVVTGALTGGGAATKTDTPVLEVPQPVTIIPADVYEAQGALSVSDTLNYVAGVQAGAYGPDSRVDSQFIRGISALQFRDGMRDLFSFYASIRADPYNFDSVQVLRGPSSVLFGAGSLGGIVNLNSKLPQFVPAAEVLLRAGSFDRKEALVDITGPLGMGVAGRIAARVRDSDTQTEFVPDDRAMVAPSLTFTPSLDTTITVLGLYQEDDGGSTSQFLPLVGTILPNPNGQLPFDLFIGKPGWDRYDGRLLQGTGLVEHRFSDALRLNLKARYIDSDLTYLTHYPDSYGNPANPFVDPEQRRIGLYVDGSEARMEVFSTDNTLQFDFATGAGVEHTLLAGVDYRWNQVRKRGGYGYETIDIYDIDYDALSDFGGGLPEPISERENVEQEQLGFYLQDQIRFWDRVSLVLGARRDRATSQAVGREQEEWNATTLRAGVIGELVEGISPFLSYTESFEPISGIDSSGDPFVPKEGRQYEAGLKFELNPASIVTLTAYHIDESNRPVSDDSTPDPTDQIQIGSLTSRGVEAEARTLLTGGVQLIAAASYNEAQIEGTGRQLDNVPSLNASLWALKPFALRDGVRLTLAGGVRHAGENVSYGAAFPNGIVTPDHTLVDAFSEVQWRNWSFALNATNLLGERYYSACLARGDCFLGAERNVFGTLGYRF